MAVSNKKIQKMYRDRMYAAGYKQARVWVPRNPDDKQAHLSQRDFIIRLTSLTTGWSARSLSKLFAGFIETINEKNREDKKKQ